MEQIIQIKCNGPNEHINEIDLVGLLKPTVAARGTDSPHEIKERYSLKCLHCSEGRVVITGEMLREMLNEWPTQIR